MAEHMGAPPIGAYYLSSGQAAARLGLCKRTLLRALHRGEIAPAYRTPEGYFRFRLADVETDAGCLTQRAKDARGT